MHVHELHVPRPGKLTGNRHVEADHTPQGRLVMPNPWTTLGYRRSGRSVGFPLLLSHPRRLVYYSPLKVIALRRGRGRQPFGC